MQNDCEIEFKAHLADRLSSALREIQVDLRMDNFQAALCRVDEILKEIEDKSTIYYMTAHTTE